MNDKEKSTANHIAELEQLQEKNEQLLKMLDNSTDMLYRMSLPDGKYEFVSLASTNLFGYTPEEFYTIPLLIKRVIHPDWHVYFEEQWHLLLAGDVPPIYEYQIIHKSGDIRWMNQRNRLVYDEKGNPIAIEGIVSDITDRKKTEKTLRESEHAFRAIIETSQDWIWAIDSNGIHTYSNPAIKSILGYVEDEIIGKYSLELIHDDDRKLVEDVLGECIRCKKGWRNLILRWRHKDGTYRYLESSAVPQLNSEGEVLGFRGVDRDISERKIVENALLESKKITENIINTIPVRVFWKDNNLVYLGCNKDFAYDAGYNDPNEIIGKDDFQLGWKQNAELFRRDDRQIIDSGIPKLLIEEPLIISNNKAITVLMSKVPLLNVQGDNIGVLGTYIDITEHIQTQNKLVIMAEMLDVAPSSITVHDFDGNFLYANKKTFEIHGYNEKEFMSLNLHQIDVPSSEQLIENRMKMISEKNEAFFEVDHFHKDGSRIPLELYVKKVEWNGIPAMLSIGTNIADRKQLEEERLKASKLESIGLLAGGIAHDFNNILTSIQGNISLVKLNIDSSSEEYEMLKETEIATIRATKLTQQLLTFAQGGAPVRETTAITDLIKETTEFTLRGTNVNNRISISPDIWNARIDKGQISQVIGNLVINAQQAMPNGGTIQINAQNVTIKKRDSLPLQEGNYIKITIADKGHGIPADHLTKIFDPYYTTKQKGSGLGLATSYSIIQRHNGLIDVESQIGIGTIFYIYLPASSNPVIEKKNAKDESDNLTGNILIMDDDEGIINVVSKMLNKLGNRVIVSRDGTETIALYKNSIDSGKPFDVVLMDLTIPGGMGGKETIKKLLELDPNAKAIVSSGYSNDPVVSNYKQYGFSAYISKPYRFDELKMVLNNVIKISNEGLEE